jgi:hypothetical protein
VVDYEVLLKKYMRAVGNAEGVFFLNYLRDTTLEENAALAQIMAELTRLTDEEFTKLPKASAKVGD